MSYAPSKAPKLVGLMVAALLVSPFVFAAAKMWWDNGLAEKLQADTFDPRADWPLATDEHAEIAANACGIEEWHWASVFTFDGPQAEEPYFGYEIASLTSEEVPYEGPREGRSWDRTERIQSINACLYASFDEQKVRANLSAPALRYSIEGRNALESDTI